MSFPDEEKLGLNHNTRHLRDNISTIPIKKRRLFFSRSPSPPPETESSQCFDHDMTKNESFCLPPVPSLEVGDLSTSLTALSEKCMSLEPSVKSSANLDVNKPPQYQDFIGHDCNDMERVENGFKDTFCDEKLVSLKGVGGPSAPVVRADLPMADEYLGAENISNQSSAAEKLSGNTELQCKKTFVNLHTIESFSIRQEQLKMHDQSYRDKEKLDVHDDPHGKSSESGPNTISSQICVHRSNWDLNIAMDTWEKSTSESAVKNDESKWSGKPGFGNLLGGVSQPNLMGAGTTSKKPNVPQPVVGEHWINVPFLSLHTSSKSGSAFYNSVAEACLDLRLKPSFNPESYANPFNLREVDTHNEMKSLSLSLTPASSASGLNLLCCGAMKHEPHGCIQQVEKKIEISGPENFVLKPVKSESSEVGETSRIAVIGAANSASDPAIKLEPVEERNQPQFSAKDIRTSHINAYDYNLSQSARIPLEAVGTGIMSSNTKPDSFINDVILHTPREYHSMLKYEMDSIDLVKQAVDVSRDNKRCHSAMSAVASIPESQIGISMGALVDEGREFISIKQASNECSEHTGFFVKCRLQEGQNMKFVSESCEQVGMAVDFLQKSSDEKAVIVSRTSSCEIDAKTRPGAETYMNSDDAILQTPKACPYMSKYEEDLAQEKQATEVYRNDKICLSATSATSIPQPEIGFAMQTSVDEGRELISIRKASNEGSEHASLFTKCRIEEGQNMNSLNESYEQDDIVVDLLQESFDDKVKVVYCTSLSEADTKTGSGIEPYLNCDVLEFGQANKGLLCMEEQGDNECKPGNKHFIDGVTHAVFEKGGVDDHNYEDGELRDGASLSANGSSYLTVEEEKAEDVCPRALVDLPMATPSAHELVKDITIGSPEIHTDPGTVECINDVDPAITADLQESSSVTGDSIGKRTSRTTRKVPRDSLINVNVFERKTKLDRDPTVVNIDNKGEENGVKEKGGESVKSSFLLSSEPIRDAFDRSRSGRIINLNSVSSRNMKHIHEGPLSSRVDREKSAYKLFKREKYRSGCSRDEIPTVRSHKTENENLRGWACRNRGSGSVHMRIRGESDSLHSRIREESKIDQFGERNSDLNYIQDQIHGHDDSRYSRSIPMAEVSMTSVADACVSFSGKISRKLANGLHGHTRMLSRRPSHRGPEQISDMHHPASEISPNRCMQRDAPDLAYVSHTKNCRTIAAGMLDRTHQHGQFERTDRISIRRERLSLSPLRRRGPRQLSPSICSPRSQALSPSHWSTHPTDGLNGQAEIVQCKSGAPVMQESMRTARPYFTEKLRGRRRYSGYGDKLSDSMVGVASSREHDFPRPGRDFSRKFQPRQFPDEYYGSSFAHGHNHELAADGDCAIRRRYNETHEPGHYRQRCIAGDDSEGFSFRAEEGSPRSYRFHGDDNQGFNEGGSSREVEGRFKNRFGNTSRRYRHIEHQQHEDGFRHKAEQEWNDSDFNNIRSRSRKY